MARSILYLDGSDLERDWEALVRFRLTYDGPLYSNPAPLPPSDPDDLTKWRAKFARRVEHKHCLRRHFHKQLKELWANHKYLSKYTQHPGVMHPILPEGAGSALAKKTNNERRPLAEILGDVYGHHGYRYAPLVWKENDLYCSLRILCLRRDHPGAVLPTRDIDNRIKTLVDALTMPPNSQGSPMKDGEPLPPQEGEDPFYVLLDDDRQVTHLEVETDTALELPPNPEDESYVRLVITAEVRSHRQTSFNQMFV
jgi:hypothetical protein